MIHVAVSEFLVDSFVAVGTTRLEVLPDLILLLRFQLTTKQFINSAVHCIFGNRKTHLRLLRFTTADPFGSPVLRFNKTDAGSSFGSWGTSSPRNALARIDCVSLSTYDFALR